MKENGNEVKTTFWEDFRQQSDLAFQLFRTRSIVLSKSGKEDYEFLTELVLVLNHKIWQYHEKRPEFAELYNTLWEQTDQYAMENLKDEELSYFFDVTD